MAHKLLRNGTLLTWDNATNSIQVLHNSSILITGDTIDAITPATTTTTTTDNDTNDLPANTEIVDVTGMILTPGLINTHCHMWQTAFRSMAPDIFIAQYFRWLSQMGSAPASFKPRDVYVSCLEGYCEGLNAGVTSFVEHAANNWSKEVMRPGREAAVDGGARVWWCYDVNTMAGEGFSKEVQQRVLREIGGETSASEALVAMGLAFDGFNVSNDEGVEYLKGYAR
jgi:cytosine/adenosine deaminase-related metal-dependent hydrolase